MASMPQPIPNTLRFRRIQAGLRQADVAVRFGFASTDRISHWERGSAAPNITNLFKLCAILKATPQELYGELWEQTQQELQDAVQNAVHSVPLPSGGDGQCAELS
jgi:transcriptional regulator with XRE-family HTH domain